MRILAALLMGSALALGAPRAHAAEAGSSAKPARQAGPLKPGPSAGVRSAQLPRTGVALVGAGAVIAVIAIVAGTGGNAPQPNLQSATTTAP